jgi:hypothetical protein
VDGNTSPSSPPPVIHIFARIYQQNHPISISALETLELAKDVLVEITTESVGEAFGRCVTYLGSHS